MLSSIEKTILLAGTSIGSIYLFSISLNGVNDALLRRNGIYNMSQNHIIDVVAVNSITMIYSATMFTYLTYVAFN